MQLTCSGQSSTWKEKKKVLKIDDQEYERAKKRKHLGTVLQKIMI
jgi:hypothetical protein